MTAEPLACPYCNAFVTVSPTAAAGQRVTCARCGETFTLRQPEGVQTGPGPKADGVTNAPPPDAFNRSEMAGNPRRANRLVAGSVLGVMLFMAAVGLAFALWTQADRRAHDTGITRRSKRPAVAIDNRAAGRITPRRPGDLEALGYLPSDTTVVLGLRVAELLDDPEGKKLWNTAWEVGGRKIVPADLVGWTGLAAKDVDHLVLAVCTEDPVAPRVYVVARARGPYDEEAVKKALQAKEPDKAKGKTVWKVTLPGQKIPFHLWFADDERTLVFSFLPGALDAVPLKPWDKERILSTDLREVLGRMTSPAPVWVAGHADNWAKGPLGKLPWNEEQGERFTRLTQALKPITTFAAWLEPGKAVTVNAVFHCRPDDKGGDGEATALAAKLKQSFKDGKVEAEERWVTFQYRTPLARIAEVLPE
jgi:hypothetical protein